jgi:hypothetical protein
MKRTSLWNCSETVQNHHFLQLKLLKTFINICRLSLKLLVASAKLEDGNITTAVTILCSDDRLAGTIDLLSDETLALLKAKRQLNIRTLIQVRWRFQIFQQGSVFDGRTRRSSCNYDLPLRFVRLT